jgi:hypothetical protein
MALAYSRPRGVLKGDRVTEEADKEGLMAALMIEIPEDLRVAMERAFPGEDLSALVRGLIAREVEARRDHGAEAQFRKMAVETLLKSGS